jgi:hypothetical protein
LWGGFCCCHRWVMVIVGLCHWVRLGSWLLAVI